MTYLFYVSFFAKFIYNEYIRPYFLTHVVFTVFASDPLKSHTSQA